jgi:hypothetical protein
MRCGAGFLRRDEALDIFCEDVDFDVDGVVGRHCVDICVLMCEGNDGDVGDAVMRVPAGDGEADAVDGD